MWGKLGALGICERSIEQSSSIGLMLKMSGLKVLLAQMAEG